jgi:hypothetical protein
LTLIGDSGILRPNDLCTVAEVRNADETVDVRMTTNRIDTTATSPIFLINLVLIT